MRTDIDNYITTLRDQVHDLNKEVEGINNEIEQQEKVFELKKHEAEQKAMSMLENYEGQGLDVQENYSEKTLPKLKNQDILKVLKNIIE